MMKAILFGNKISCGATQTMYEKTVKDPAFVAKTTALGVVFEEADYRASNARYKAVKKQYPIIVTNGSILFPQIILTDTNGKLLDIFLARGMAASSILALITKAAKECGSCGDVPETPDVPATPSDTSCPTCPTCPTAPVSTTSARVRCPKCGLTFIAK